jgi:hypothetical protein
MSEGVGQAAKFRFKFGQLDDSIFWDEGERSPLVEAKPATLRSIAEECRTNDGGKWLVEYEYIASAEAVSGRWEFKGGARNPHADGVRVDCSWPAVRDRGHKGMTLQDFETHPAAKAAKLSRAEVAMLRLYTGPMFRPLNGALRGQGGQRALRDWWSCITVLICAVFKMSFAPSNLAIDATVKSFGDSAPGDSEVSSGDKGETGDARARPTLALPLTLSEQRAMAGGPRQVFRGLPVQSLADCDEAQAGASLNFEKDGGVELAFCSTTTDRAVALAFSKGKGGVLLRFELSSTTRAAGVQWVSQYPEEAEWLLPPYTMLKPAPAGGRTPRKAPISSPNGTAARISMLSLLSSKLGFRRSSTAAADEVSQAAAVRDRDDAQSRGTTSAIAAEQQNTSGGMRELHFEATVRVPFQELDIRCADLESPPCTQRRDTVSVFEVAGSGRFSAGILEHMLLTGRVTAGIVGFKRGFFGGCGPWSIALYLVLGGVMYFLAFGYASNVSSSVSPLGGNGPVISPLLSLGVFCFGTALEFRACILLMLNVPRLRAFINCCSGRGAKAPLLMSRPAQNSDCSVQEVGPGFSASNPGCDDGSPDIEARGIPNPDHEPALDEVQLVWERRTVDNLPQLFTCGAVWMLSSAGLYLALTIVYSTKGYTISITPTNPKVQGGGIASLYLAAAACFGFWMFRTIAIHIRSGRKRKAQKLFNGFLFFCGIGLAVMNLPKALEGEGRGASTAFVSLQRGLAGLGASCYCIASYWSRYKADKEASAKILEDAMLYISIFRTLQNTEADQLALVRVRTSAANGAAARELAETLAGDRSGASGCCSCLHNIGAHKSLNDPRQPNARELSVSYGGEYLSDLYACAIRWSSEFRQITTRLAVLSGCRLEVPSGREYDGIKDSERAVEKVCRGYGGRCDRLLDLLRATIVADDVGQMLAALDLLHGKDGKCFDERLSVCRIKNKMDVGVSVKGGFRNIHVNLMLRRPQASRQNGFLCELQIHHRDLWDAEQSAAAIRVVDGEETTPHGRYIRFRNNRAE